MRKITPKYLSALCFFSFLFCSIPLFSQTDIPSKPEEHTSVYDQAGLLTSYEANALQQKLINYADSTSTQIVVASIKTINGENISLFATNWAHSWGIGQEDKDNGVFILIAKDDRKMAIQTGYGVEHLLTDNLSKRIITNIITPEFKRGNFYAGLDRGTSAIIQILNGEYQETRDFSNQGDKVPLFFIILVFIILLIVLSNIKRRGGGKKRRRFRDDDTARSILEAIILSKSGRGGFGGGGFGGSSGGGSFGGGSFGGGFGGGGFGGGGASGGW